MSPCLGGGRSFIKSPSSTTSSSSSTLSESNSNFQLAIWTRKPRTPRKRPNQSYNEAAALLSTACPAVFSAKPPQKFTNLPHDFFLKKDQSSQLLLPFPVTDQPKQAKPRFRIQSKPSNCYEKPTNMEVCEDDFDTESILDDEIEEGIIDNIMGATTDATATATATATQQLDSLYGYPMGMRKGVKPLRNAGDEGSWWCSPTVYVLEINKPSSPPAAADGKKRRSSVAGQPLLLKLNYDEVVEAWSDRGLPFPEELKAPENDVSVTSVEDFQKVDLCRREASVIRYKEKRGRRILSKKIRYHGRKLSADQRPRIKGRFQRRPNCSTSSQV